MTSSGRPHVRLRPWSAADGDLLARLVGDPAMMEHLGGAERPEQVRRRQSRYAEPGSGMYVVVDAATGERVGSVGFWPREQDPDVYETGWSILPEHQGRGLAQAATREVVALARAAGDRRRLCAYPNVANAASNALCERLGFRLEGASDFEYPPGHRMRCNTWCLDLAADR